MGATHFQSAGAMSLFPKARRGSTSPTKPLSTKRNGKKAAMLRQKFDLPQGVNRPDELQTITPMAESSSAAMSPFGFPPNHPLSTVAGKPPRVPRLASLAGSNGEVSSEFIPPQLSEREIKALGGKHTG